MSQTNDIRSGIGLWEGTDDVCRRCGRHEPIGAYCARCIPIVRQALSDGIWWLCLMQCAITGLLLTALFVLLGEPANAASGKPAAFFWPDVYLDPLTKTYAMVLMGIFAASDVAALLTAVFMDLPSMLAGRRREVGRIRLHDIDLALRNAGAVIRSARLRSREEKIRRLIEEAKLEEKYVGPRESNRRAKLGYDPFSTGWSLWLTVRAVGIGIALAARWSAHALRTLLRRTIRAVRWLVPRAALLLHAIEWVLGLLLAGVHALRCWLGHRPTASTGGVRLSAAHYRRPGVFDEDADRLDEWDRADPPIQPDDPTVGGMLARCPSCGRQRRVHKEGAYRCSACGLEFSVGREGSVIRTSCPACGRAKPAPKLGRYRCKSCETVFHLTRNGCRIEGKCPGCGKTRPVDHPGKYRCSQCGRVFEVKAGKPTGAAAAAASRPDEDRQTADPPSAALASPAALDI